MLLSQSSRKLDWITDDELDVITSMIHSSHLKVTRKTMIDHILHSQRTSPKINGRLHSPSSTTLCVFITHCLRHLPTQIYHSSPETLHLEWKRHQSENLSDSSPKNSSWPTFPSTILLHFSNNQAQIYQ